MVTVTGNKDVNGDLTLSYRLEFDFVSNREPLGGGGVSNPTKL